MSPSASPTRPRASAALAASALLSNSAAMRASSSAAARARSRSPAATSISTCASSRGARRSSVFGGSSLDGTFSGMLERVADGLRSQGDVAPGQVHQGEAGLRVPPDLVRRAEGLLRALDVSPAQPDAAKLGQRPPELPAQVGAQLLAGQEGFLLRLAAGPAQPEDLGAVDAAAAVDAPDGLPVAPPLHRLRPLLGQVVLREPLERAHQLAVDDPRREGIELAGDGGHGGFVEEPEALLDLALQDEAAGLGHPANGGGRRIAPRADLDGAPGPVPSTLEVARQQPFVVPHHRQPGVDRRLVVALQQPFRRA